MKTFIGAFVIALASSTEAFVSRPAFTSKRTALAATVAAKPDIALAEKLLCANVVAQSVNSTTLAYRTDAYYTGAGFTRDPVICIGGVKNNDCCIVSTIDGAIVVAYRGTISAISDWLVDAQVWHKPQAAGKFPGLLHSGFLAATSHVWSKDAFKNAPLVLTDLLLDMKVPQNYAMDEIKKLQQETGYDKIYITGHSKGAAMATLGSWFCHVDIGITPECYTFASPYPGNKAFGDAYDAVVTQFSYENYHDIVCIVPPPDPSYLTDLTEVLAQQVVPAAFQQTMGMGFAALSGVNELVEMAVGLFDYVPVGQRYVVKDGKITTFQVGDNTGDAFEKYRDDRWKTIISKLVGLGSVGAAGAELGSQHAKICKGTSSKGVYQFSVNGENGICKKA